MKAESGLHSPGRLPATWAFMQALLHVSKRAVGSPQFSRSRAWAGSWLADWNTGGVVNVSIRKRECVCGIVGRCDKDVEAKAELVRLEDELPSVEPSRLRCHR